MHNPGSVDAAAKIAGFYHLPGLQERMGGVVVKKKKVEYHPARYGNGNGNGGGSGEREKSKGFNDLIDVHSVGKYEIEIQPLLMAVGMGLISLKLLGLNWNLHRLRNQ
jgi:hypothetical protein